MILGSIEQSPLGDLLMASEEGKIVFSSFIENRAQSLNELCFYLKLKEWKLELFDDQLMHLHETSNVLGTEA
jgi:hypothetical protein